MIAKFKNRNSIVFTAGAIAVALGLLCYFGLIFDIPLFHSVLTGFVQMNSVTALNFVLTGLSLTLVSGNMSGNKPIFVKILSAAVFLLSMLSLLSVILGADISADIIFPQSLRSASIMSPLAAVIFVLLSIAFYLLVSASPRAGNFAQYLVLASGFFALLVFLGYLYDITAFYFAGTIYPMALNTSITFLVVCTGLLFLNTKTGLMSLMYGKSPSAILARRLIPAIVLFPVVLGWLRLAGQKAGLYNDATGVALFVVIIITSLFFFVLFTAKKLKMAEKERDTFEINLIESEIKLKAILDNSPSAIYLKDLNNKFIMVNKTTQRNHNLTEKEILGKSLSDLFPNHPEAVAGYESNDKKVVLSGKAHEFEEEAVLADGKHTYFSQKFPLKDLEGNVYAVCGISTDITFRKNATDKVIAILESAPDAIVIVDIAGIVQVVNRQTEKLFGYDRNEIIGYSVEMLLPQEVRSRHVHHRNGFVNDHSTRPMGSGLELFALKKNGDKFPVEISLSPIETAEGMLVSAAIRDITDRKLKDEKLKQLNIKLTESNNELESFSYSVSHDLRAPLRHIIGFGEKLKRISTGRLSDEELRLLLKITGSAEKMGRLIDDLLMFSRVGRTGLSISLLDMDKLAEEVISEISLSGKLYDYSINTNKMPEAKADPFQLKIVLHNLLGNAIKYTGSSPVKKIEIGGYVEGGDNIYFIKDTGCGFDMEYHDKLFGVFQRLHRDDEYEGTGIGLATVKRIISRHSGKIWAKSEIGKGSEFYFSLPNNFNN